MGKKQLCVQAVVFFSGLVALASGPTFKADVQFTGSTTKGWHSFGGAAWSASNGTITGTPGAGGSGWLVLDESYQDISFFTEFRCEAGCETGVLFRAEKTPDGGMKGVLVSLNDSALETDSVTIDKDGKI